MKLFHLFVILAVVMFAAAPATAGGCDTEPTIDAKVISYTWPAGIGVNFAVFDFRAALEGWGLSACAEGSVDTLGLLRLVPGLAEKLPAFMAAPAPVSSEGGG